MKVGWSENYMGGTGGVVAALALGGAFVLFGRSKFMVLGFRDLFSWRVFRVCVTAGAGGRLGLCVLLAISPLRGAETVTLDLVEVTERTAEVARSSLPGAITAYGGDFLTANGIAGYADLAAIVPGFFAMEQTVENVSLNLRGLTSDTNDPRSAPRVSVFQDGVLLANSHGQSVALFDVSDVAVFKGPQPTQFGRGVQGGALALTSNRAVNARSSVVTVGVGERNAANAEIVVNRPIVAEKVFARVAVQAHRREGYVKNRADGSDLQGEGTLALRTSLRWQPAAATTVDAIFNWQRDDTPGLANKSMTGVPGLSPLADLNPFAPVNLNRGAELGVTRTILGLTGVMSHRLNEAWTVTATSAWREVESNHEFDIDGSLYYLFESGEAFRGRQVSQEVRWVFDERGRWTAMAGVALMGTKDEQAVIVRSDENALWRFFTRTPPPIAFNSRYAERNATGAETTVGEVFGRADYKLTERVTLGAGGRLTWERLRSQFESFAAATPGNLVGLLPTSGRGNNLLQSTRGRLEHGADVGSWSGQVDARFAITPQVTAYSTVSRGRRPPALDYNEITLAAQTHAEETVWNVEAGIKGASGGGRLRYAASVFQYDFGHFQSRRIVAPGVIQPYDGGRARGQGFEVTGSAELARERTHGVTGFATYGFTDTAFSARDGGGAPQLYAGNTFRLTSRHVVTVGGTVTRAMGGGGTVFFTPRFTYRSAFFFEDNNAQNGGILRQGGYGLTDVRLGFRPRGGRWEVVGSANNVFEKKYLLDAGNFGGGLGIPTSVAAVPRTVGVKATVRF